MKDSILIFFFALSVLYTLRVIVEFVIKLTQDNPTPMTLNWVRETLLYVSLSYIITYILI